VSANYPPPDASKNDVDRFMLQFTHRRDEDIPDQEMWFSGIYATEEKPWPKDLGIAVVDAKGRVCRCVAEIRRALTEAAFPFELWWPKTSPVKWISFAGANCINPCRGWDQVSGRCDCGNRRVYWDSNDGGKPFARAD
jgi:hypothetical protein